MVDYRKLFGRLVGYSNEKQNSYLSNIFGVSGGAVMYTAWQRLLIEDHSHISSIEIFTMLILSIILITIGYVFLGKKYETSNT